MRVSAVAWIRSEMSEGRAAPAVRTRDPQRTRRAILDAGLSEFAARGLSGAGVAAIAETAGVNKRMIYHYFGSKEGLFRAVIESVYEELADAAASLEAETDDPREGVRRLVRFIWEFYSARPGIITLLNAENLHGARHIRDSERVSAMGAPFLAVIRRLLRRGASSGLFRDDVEPLELYLSIVALSYYYLSNRHTLSVFFGRDLMQTRQRRRWARHVERMVLDFLAHGAPGSAPEGRSE